MMTSNKKTTPDVTHYPSVAPVPAIVPEKDNITHINIYKYSASELGKLLAPVTHMPFVHPTLGSFQNLQGFWEWIRSKDRPDALRFASGSRAIGIGRSLVKIRVDDFEAIFLEASFCRIDQNQKLRELFLRSTLPFDMYFLMDPNNPESLAQRPGSRDIVVDTFTKLRTMMSFDEMPPGFGNYRRPLSSR